MKPYTTIMKNYFLILLLVASSASSFGKTYYIYTATTSGNWDNNTTWNIVVRTDNIMKDKFIIPSSLTVTADNDVNTLGYTDVELQISGSLKLASSTTLNFGNSSKIEIFSTGVIDGNGSNQVINIGGVAKYVGNKNKTLAGPLYADATTGTAPSGFKSFSSLSVHFLSFTVSDQNDQSVLIKWTTAKEVNNSYFEIEQSVNDNPWTKVATMKAATSSSSFNSYSYTHKKVSGRSISYRLKQVDMDGKFEYSTVALISRNNFNESVNIFASGKAVTVELLKEVKADMQVRIINLEGRVLSTQTIAKSSAKIVLYMNNLSTGNYVVVVSNSNTNSVVKKIYIN
jgi:hypothetical protein